jgi:hypothetical protein
LQADARRRFGIIRTAAWHVGAVQERPAERGIDEKIGAVADKKLLRRGELADTHIHLFAEILPDPEIEQPGRGRLFDAAHRHQVIEFVGAELRAVNLLRAGVKGAAGPADELFQIGIDDGAEPAVIPKTALHAAGGVSESVAVISEGELHAGLLQPGAEPAPVG